MLTISYQSSSYEPIEPFDLESCTNQYEIQVFYTNDESEVFEEPILIGKGSVYLLLIAKAMNTGCPIYDMLDNINYEELFHILFNIDDDMYKEEWVLRFIEKDVFCNNILLLDRLEILPKYRNQGYGKMVTNSILNHFYGCFGIAVLHSFPLQLELFDNNKDQWRSMMEYNSMEHNEIKAKKSLYKLYKDEGFKRYKKTEYFYRLAD